MDEIKKAVKNYKEMNTGSKVILLLIIVGSLSVLMLHLPIISSLYVLFVEKMIIHRQSADPQWLVEYSLMIIDGFWWLFVISVWQLIFAKKASFGYVAYSIFAFFYTNILIWNNNAFKGYFSVWDYGDFTAVIQDYSNKGCYTSNYPPFAVMIIKLLGNILKGKQQPQISESYLCFLVSLISIFILSVSLYSILSSQPRGIDHKNSVIFIACFLISGPVMFAYQRLNVSVIAVSLVALFVFLYRSDKALYRHIALVSLAIAANLKYYPAIFGLLLLRKKRYKEAVICFFEGITCFFVPVIYDRITFGDSQGGIISGLLSGTSDFTTMFLSRGGVSIKKILYDIYTVCGKNPSGLFFETTWWCVLAAYLIISVYLIFRIKEDDHAILLMVMACIFVPAISFWYAVELMLIPLALLLKRTHFEFVFADRVEILLYTYIIAYIMGYPKFLNAYQYLHLLLLLVFVICRHFCGGIIEKRDN